MDLKSKILTIGIALLLVFFIFIGIETFYPSPKYENFCKEELNFKSYETQAVCEEAKGKWMENYPKPICPPSEKCPQGYCDIQYFCRKDFEEVNKAYEHDVFLLGVSFGIVLFIIGFLLQLETVGAGITGGSVIIMTVAVVRYWGNLSDYAKFGILGLALAVLIYIAYKRTTKALASNTKKSKRKR